MPSTNFTKIARKRESSIGVAPTGAYEYAYVTGESLKPANSFERSETITGVRRIKEHLLVGKAATGGVNFQWAYGYSDPWIELALNDAFVAMEEAYNATADSNITQITAATETMLAAGDWVEGMLISTTGLPTADNNNKRFRAQSGSGAGTIVGPSGTFETDDAAPQAGARALCVGIKGATGDLSATATGIQTAGDIDFTNFPISAGVGVKIKGFGTAACNVFATIESFDATDLTLGNLPADWTTDAGSGVEIELFIGDFAEDSDTALTDTIEKTNTKTSAQAYESYVGIASQTFNFELALNSTIRASNSLIGFYANDPATVALGSSYTDPIIGTGNLMKTGPNIARLTEGGAAISAGNECQRLGFTLNNNYTPVGDITKDWAIDYNEGDFECIIDADYRFKSKALYEKFHLGTLTSQFFVVYRGNQAYMIEVREGLYTDGGILSEARNGELVARMRMEASQSGTGSVVRATRFREWN